jgi:hypothetical protein
MLLVVVTFPFCTPLPRPGLSIPFGLVVAFIGLGLSLGQKPWLPAMIVLLLSAAILEQDGYVAMAGGGVFVVTLGYFAAIFRGGAEVVELLSDRFGWIFPPDDLPAQPRSDP